MATQLNNIDIEKMLREHYEPLIIEALQEQNDLFTPHARVYANVDGDSVEMDSGGKTELVLRTKKYEAKPINELEWGKRFMYLAMFAQTLNHSESDMMRTGAFAGGMSYSIQQLRKAATRAYMRTFLGVAYDTEKRYWTIPNPDTANAAGTNSKSPFSEAQVYVGGILGRNYTGERGMTPEDFPTQISMSDGTLSSDYETDFTTVSDMDFNDTSVVPANFAYEGSPAMCGLTLDKIMAVKEMLETRDPAHGGGDMYSMAITPRQQIELLRMDKLQNSLYGFQAIKDGMISEVLNIRFIVSNMVPVVKLPSNKLVRVCPIWKPESVAFGVWQAPKTRVVEMKETTYDGWAIDCQLACGAARRIPEEVLAVHCFEGATAA